MPPSILTNKGISKARRVKQIYMKKYKSQTRGKLAKLKQL